MKTKNLMILAVGITTAFLMPGLASAQEDKCVYSEKQDDVTKHIVMLRKRISDSEFTINKKIFGDVSRDQVGLDAKAAAALSKAMEESYGDSMAKLEDITSKVIDLVEAAKTKLDEKDGDDILYLTELAYNCVLDVQMERL